MISRFQTYVLTTFFVLFLLALSYMYNITPVLDYAESVYYNAQNIYILIPALISTIVLMKQGGYWLFMFICALADSFYICYDMGVGMSNMSFFILNIVTFLGIAFLINTVIALIRG